MYKDEMPILKKVETIAKEIYGATGIQVDEKITAQIKKIEEAGFSKFPVCIAKTQYSFSTDPKLKGAPVGHSLPIREVRLSSGAEFVVVVCGAIMTMPGLPKVPAADSIKLNNKGEIEGLFLFLGNQIFSIHSFFVSSFKKADLNELIIKVFISSIERFRAI